MAKWNKKIVERAEAYLQQKINSKTDPIPYIEELAEELGVSDTTIGTWQRTYPEFKEIYDRLHRRQKLMLMKMGMSRKVATPMAIFQLKANHGFIESQHVDHTTKGEKINTVDLSTYKNLSDEELAKKASEQIAE